MRLCLWMTLLVLAPGGTRTSNGGEPDVGTTSPARFRLDNGLTAIVRPIERANDVALVVLYKIGGDHDPEGRSGLAHMVEHVYITAAAGSGRARTAEEFFRRYRSGGNAQTGDRYTVVATVFPKADLGDELREAAARMGDLRVTAADLDRERPRVLDEVANMFGRIPPLGALNNARELIRPTPQGGRKGGLPGHLPAITLDEIRGRWQDYYKPRNAILVLTGGIDPTAARVTITGSFAKLAPGKEVPAPSEPGVPNFGVARVLAVESPQARAQPEACLAYKAPDPASDLYAPFLVLVSRLWALSSKKLGGEPGRSPVYFPVLDDPAIVGVSTRANRGETDHQVRARLEVVVAEAVAPKLGANERDSVQQMFGFPLGTTSLPDPVLAMNPYGVAFSLARREQLGIDPASLNRALQAVTDQDLHRAANEIFAPGRHASVFITAND